MNRARRFWSDMARNTIGPGELTKQPREPATAAFDIWIDLSIGALQISVRQQPRSAVPGADDVDHIQIMRFDHPVEMHIDEIQARGRAPMPKQPRFDVGPFERT